MGFIARNYLDICGLSDFNYVCIKGLYISKWTLQKHMHYLFLMALVFSSTLSFQPELP